jgi:hypothetical protein
MSDATREAGPTARPTDNGRACRPEDFDGHTNFASLTAEQRLEWLDEAARLVIEFKGRARPARLPQ